MIGLKTLISNKIFIENPNEEIIKYCNEKLTLNNPQYYKLQRMNKWTGNTPKTISLYEKNGDMYILPFGCLTDIWTNINNNYEVDFGSNNPVDFEGNINLYDYQEKAVNEAIKSKNGVLVGQCGCGKTQIGIGVIARIGLKALWITHTKELLNQSKQRYIQYFGSDDVGVITEGKVDIGAKITFATVQTLSNIDLQSYADTWDTVIVDECHRLCGTPTKVTMFYKVLSSLKARYKYGVTATAHRSDGLIQSMFAILGPIIHEIPKSAVADKTMEVQIKPIFIEMELSRDCFDTDGTIIFTKALNEIALDEVSIDRIVNNLKANAHNYNLVLSDRLEQLREIKAKLHSDKAVMIDGSMTSRKGKAQREKAIRLMQEGKMHYLFASYNLAKEGLDIPRLNRLHLATPKKDKSVVTQSLGRIARKFDGKKDAICYDYVHSNWLCQSMWKARQAVYKKL